MPINEKILFVSDWDSSHFDTKIAKSFPTSIHHIRESEIYVINNNVDLLITRCDVSNITMIHELLAKNHLLMDTLVRYRCDFRKNNWTDHGLDPNIRHVEDSDEMIIKDLTKLSFENYNGHFHNDPRLPNDLCTSIYVKWAVNSINDISLANAMYVYDAGHGVEGFITIKKLDNFRSDGVLACVAPESQGKGIYRKLIEYAMSWSVDNGAIIMELGPLLDNYAVQRVWQRLGFEIYTAKHTFHKWFDNSSNNG